MDDLHIAVFAKAPQAGQCKTRLIPLLGAEGAMQAHCAMTLHALQIARAAATGQVSLWSAGDRTHPFLQQAASRFGATLVPQCEGDLGQRMAHCLHTMLMRHPRVILIGSDCPVLSVADLHSAADALQRAAMIFTPSEDGGYVLVGAAAGRRPIGTAFAGIEWSTAAVMQQTRKNLSGAGWIANVDWVELPARWDVDEPADYLRAQREGLLDADGNIGALC